MELSELIKNYRKRNKMTMQEFADKANLSKGFISQLENDYRRNKENKRMIPSLAKYKQLAKAMNMDINQLLNLVDSEISIAENDSDTNVDVPLPTQEPVTDILIYGALSCGTGLFVDDAIIGHISVPVSMLPNKSAEYFAQYASGDSMIGAGIENGDLLVFEKTQQLDNGQIGTFCIDDNIATCKKFSRVGGNVYLLPANDSFEPIPVAPDNSCFRVVGVLALKISKKQL